MHMHARITPRLIVYVHAQQLPIRFFKLPTEWPRYVETLNKARDDELTCFESWHFSLDRAPRPLPQPHAAGYDPDLLQLQTQTIC